MLAYFDTNVFDHLFKKTDKVTDADELQLREAVSSGRLTIVVGHINIRETLAALRASPEIVGPELSLIASLANWDYFVRFHSAILEGDVRHFAYNGERANTAFESEHTVANIRSAVLRVIDDKIPSVRAMVGVGMSFIYRTAVEKKSPKGSDSRDLQHAVCAAAAADVFVTHDVDLSLLLHRVPIKGLRVLRLHQLLEAAHCTSRPGDLL